MLSLLGSLRDIKTTQEISIPLALVWASNMSQTICRVSLGSNTCSDSKKTPSFNWRRSSKSLTKVYKRSIWANTSLKYFYACFWLSLTTYYSWAASINIFCRIFIKNMTDSRGVFISWLTVDVKLSAWIAKFCFSRLLRSCSFYLIFFVTSFKNMTFAALPS